MSCPELHNAKQDSANKNEHKWMKPDQMVDNGWMDGWMKLNEAFSFKTTSQSKYMKFHIKKWIFC